MCFKARLRIDFCLGLAILMVLCPISVIIVTSASCRELGVAQGQLLYYTGSTYSTGGNDTELMSSYSDDTYWYNVTVLAVSEQNVTYFQGTNDTALPPPSVNATIELNAESGSANNIVHPLFFICANLSVNDPVYDSVNYQPMRINETQTRNYLGTTVEVNHLQTVSDYLNLYYGGIFRNATLTTEYYWDIASGVALEMVISSNMSRSDDMGGMLVYSRTNSMTVHTAVPMIPEFPSFLVPPLFMIGALLVMAILRRKHLTRAL